MCAFYISTKRTFRGTIVASIWRNRLFLPYFRLWMGNEPTKIPIFVMRYVLSLWHWTHEEHRCTFSFIEIVFFVQVWTEYVKHKNDSLNKTSHDVVHDLPAPITDISRILIERLRISGSKYFGIDTAEVSFSIPNCPGRSTKFFHIFFSFRLQSNRSLTSNRTHVNRKHHWKAITLPQSMRKPQNHRRRKWENQRIANENGRLQVMNSTISSTTWPIRQRL